MDDKIYEMLTDALPDNTEDIEDMLLALYRSNYNTSKVLPDQPEKLKQALKDIVDKLDKNWDKYRQENVNIPLLVSLYNYYNNSTVTKPTNISGAGFITRMDEENTGTIIYLLFDYTHSYEDACKGKSISVTSFLEQTLLQSDKFLDIFIETNRTETVEEGESRKGSFLTDAITFLKPCFNPKSRRCDKIVCKCPHNSRVHYIDMRETVGLYQNLRLFLSDVEYAHDNPQNSDVEGIYGDFSDNREYISEDINILKDACRNKNNYTSWVKQIISDNNVLYKELDKLEEDIRELIVKECIEYTWILIDYKKIYKTLSIISDLFDTANRETIFSGIIKYDLYTELSPVFAFIMDIYCLSRMLKLYDNTKNRYDPDYAKYIIFYGGSEHIKCYIYVLEKLGFKVTKEVKGEKPSCVNTKKLKLPLFS